MWKPTEGIRELVSNAGAKATMLNLFEGRPLADHYTWYVSYRSNIMPRRCDCDGQRRVARATRKFKGEADAKEFAREIIAQGWSAIAGTLNPHLPKRMVSSRQILDWIDGKI
jgi:hypothetical protein